MKKSNRVKVQYNNRSEVKKSKKIGLVILIILILLWGYLGYYQLFYKSKQVEGNIFRLSKTFSGHSSDVWAVKFSPNEKWIASGSVDSTVILTDVVTGNKILTLKQPEGITYLDFSPDSNYLATASYDATIRLWKLPEGILTKEFNGHTKTVWSVCFSPDGKTLASGSEDGTVKLWNVQGGQLMSTLQGHSLTVWDVKFSRDGQQLASGSFDKTIKIWDTNNGKLLHTLEKHTQAIVAITFSHDGTLLASTGDDQSIKLWDTHRWTVTKSLDVPEHVQAADFSPNDKFLVTGGRDKPGTGEFLQNFFGDSKYNKGISMRLWDVRSGELLQTFSQHANDVNDVAFSTDGKWIASCSSDKTVILWQLTNQ